MLNFIILFELRLSSASPLTHTFYGRTHIHNTTQKIHHIIQQFRWGNTLDLQGGY